MYVPLKKLRLREVYDVPKVTPWRHRPWPPKSLASSHNPLEMRELQGKIFSANKFPKLSEFRRIQEQKAGSLLPTHTLPGLPK